jgi:hypothetical protein
MSMDWSYLVVLIQFDLDVMDSKLTLLINLQRVGLALYIHSSCRGQFERNLRKCKLTFNGLNTAQNKGRKLKKYDLTKSN